MGLVSRGGVALGSRLAFLGQCKSCLCTLGAVPASGERFVCALVDGGDQGCSISNCQPEIAGCHRRRYLAISPLLTDSSASPTAMPSRSRDSRHPSPL